uniref:Uncharacterized protein n=1 Tax=Esox lucius TaxID=8010 RepID=A0A3P8XK23_ESOLU
MAHVTEDHSLGDSDGSIDITECCELLLFIAAEHVVLLDGVQSLLLTFQLDDVGVWHHPLCKLPHRVLKCGGEQPLDSDALVLVTLCGDHDVSLVQHKDADLLGVDDLEFGAPVQDRARCPNDDLLLELHPSVHWSAHRDTQDSSLRCGSWEPGRCSGKS